MLYSYLQELPKYMAGILESLLSSDNWNSNHLLYEHHVLTHSLHFNDYKSGIK